MSIVTAIHGDDRPPAWTPWDGAPVDVPDRGFAWIDVIDAKDEEIEALQQVFGLHELAVEDSMADAPLAKVHLYADHIFIAAKAAEVGEDAIDYTDVGIFLADRRIITVCRMKTGFGRRLRGRIGHTAGRSARSPEYAVHQVLDLIVDAYFPVIQAIAEEVLELERRLLDRSLEAAEIARIFQLRRETVHFQHVLTRMTEVCNKLANLDADCLSNDSKPYFRDLLDNLIRIEAMSNGLIDVVRAALEASSLLEQQRQSDITRKLAAWAGILAVPTAIAGIYGMNFDLPGSGTSWGYGLVLGTMISASLLLFWRFRSLQWL